jgi:hypothetical protein
VVDLSLDEEDLFPDTSRHEEFTRKLFCDLNCGPLRLPSDGNVIILSDSNEEEDEVCEEDTTDVDVTPSSAVKSPAPAVSIADANVVPEGVQDDNSDGGDEVDSPYATMPKGVFAGSEG